MTELYVSTAGLEIAHSALGRSSAEIARILSELDSQVEHLRGHWTGEASDAYDLAQSQWMGALTEMQSLLTDHARSLEKIEQRYKQAGKKISTIWSS